MRVTPDDALAAAEQALAADLRATNSWTPAARAALDEALAARREWVAAWPAGAEHVPGLVAQDVQEAIHERIDRGWPHCAGREATDHDDHALTIEPDLGPDPFWVCDVSGFPVAPVGGL